MLFALWALGHTWFWSSVNQLNRHWQLPGARLIRWRIFIPPLILLPITLFLTPPTDPTYWIATFISAGMVSLHDMTMYNVSAKYGAQVAFRLRPLILPAVFIVWLILYPAQFDALLASPVIAACILACHGAATFFLMRLNQCVITKAAMIEMIPVIITGIIFEVTNKTAMDHAAFPNNTIYYVFTVSGAPMIVSLIMAGKNAKNIIKDMSGIAKQGVLLGSIVVLSMTCKNLAMMSAPNPAYVTAITLTAPFWISLYLKIRGEKEEADWVAGTGLVISIIIMTLLAANLRH
jgi:hypothetical protein